MVFPGKILVVSSALLLASNACWATESAQSQPEPTPETAPAPQQSDGQDGAVQAEPPQSSSPPAGPPEQGSGAPAADAPLTEHDNTAWRFDMQQNGENLSADEFDAWLKAKGVRVATGTPAIPLVQNCPTPEGDRRDSDGDGIINCLDQCTNSEVGQAIGPDGCPVPISIDLKGVTFAYDKATIDPTAREVLDEAAEILKRHETLKVEVAGHTDSRGDARYNQTLSERRAKAVYDYLVESGVDDARLIGPIGFGETRPLVPNEKADGSDDPQGRGENRRTELKIQN